MNTDLQKVFAKHMSDKGLVSKELKKIKAQQTTKTKNKQHKF